MIATPSALPTFCIVESAPEAAPACAGGQARPSTVVVSGVSTSPMPAPTSSSPGVKHEHVEPPTPTSATVAASSRVARGQHGAAERRHAPSVARRRARAPRSDAAR